MLLFFYAAINEVLYSQLDSCESLLLRCKEQRST
jgi:hypothetical protein